MITHNFLGFWGFALFFLNLEKNSCSADVNTLKSVELLDW